MDNSREQLIFSSQAYISSAQINVEMHRLYNDWDAVEEGCLQICETAIEVLSLDNLEGEIKQQMYKALCVALHNLALSRYLDDDYSGALKYLEQIDLDVYPLSSALMGRCCQMAITNATGNDKKAWEEMLKYLRIFEENEDAIFAENPTGIDQVLFSRAYFNLSLSYRAGLSVNKNLKTAQQYLIKGLTRLDEENAVKSLKDELAHFKTGLFGDLKYV